MHYVRNWENVVVNMGEKTPYANRSKEYIFQGRLLFRKLDRFLRETVGNLKIKRNLIFSRGVAQIVTKIYLLFVLIMKWV